MATQQVLATPPKSQLRVKSFYANSIKEAMEQARREMGREALMLNSRESSAEAKHLGAYEVVFGCAPEETAPPAKPAETAPAGTLPVKTPPAFEPPPWMTKRPGLAAAMALRAPAPAPPAPAVPFAHGAAQNGIPATRMAQMNLRLERIRERFAHIAQSVQRNAKPGVVEQALNDADVDRAMAHQIQEAVRQRLKRRNVVPMPVAGRPGWSAEEVVAETAAEIAARFEVDATLGRIAALVGPPGAGKTTALVKLAVREGVARKRPVHLITADTQRIGAAAQLQAYARILGAGFEMVESVQALAVAVDRAPQDALVLIDTPGYSATLLADHGRELMGYLSGRQDIDTHLILTASMRPADLHVAASLYLGFSPRKILFTHLDETRSLGPVFCEAAALEKPLSFFAMGQSIPEDLEEASKERVVESLVRQLPDALTAVA